MLASFQSTFKIPDLRKRIVFTALMLVVYRLGGHITLPGVNRLAIMDFFPGVQLYEGWDGSGAEDWPKQYPQPTVADEELATQLDAALASTG